VVAQDRAAVGRGSGEHHAKTIDDAAFCQVGGLGGHVPPAHAGDEIHACGGGANSLCHDKVKYPLSPRITTCRHDT
jgi:hypothetical protein